MFLINGMINVFKPIVVEKQSSDYDFNVGMTHKKVIRKFSR